jgi:hypothetical protein
MYLQIGMYQQIGVYLQIGMYLQILVKLRDIGFHENPSGGNGVVP